VLICSTDLYIASTVSKLVSDISSGVCYRPNLNHYNTEVHCLANNRRNAETGMSSTHEDESGDDGASSCCSMLLLLLMMVVVNGDDVLSSWQMILLSSLGRQAPEFIRSGVTAHGCFTLLILRMTTGHESIGPMWRSLG